jgi:hypothetical protein
VSKRCARWLNWGEISRLGCRGGETLSYLPEIQLYICGITVGFGLSVVRPKLDRHVDRTGEVSKHDMTYSLGHSSILLTICIMGQSADGLPGIHRRGDFLFNL